MPVVTINEYLVACFLLAVIIKPSNYNIALINSRGASVLKFLGTASLCKKETETPVIVLFITLTAHLAPKTPHLEV